MREIELTFQKNIRDLGGLVGYQGMKVKNGVLYRGGFLDKITLDDARVLESLKINTVIDFRSTSEFLNRPDYRLHMVGYFNFPPLRDNANKEQKHLADSNLLWFVSDDSTGNDHMIQTYRDMVTTKEGIKAYRDFFKLLLSKEDGVFYFHCSQGKDRAGLAAFFIEVALGVCKEDILKDYLLSNKAMKVRADYLLSIVQDKPFYNERYKQSLYDMFSAKEEFLDAAIEEMEKMSGSVLKYIEEVLGVDINLLRERFLEK